MNFILCIKLMFMSPEQLQYSVRRSRRARNLLLKISVSAGLEVVVPERARIDSKTIERFVRSRSEWIQRTLKRFEKMQEKAALLEKSEQGGDRFSEPVKMADLSFPDRIDLPGIGEKRTVIYLSGRPNSLSYSDNGMELILDGCLDDDLRKQVMSEWLSGLARITLVPRIRKLACMMDLGSLNKVFIRRQKTRWGSCSAAGNINLNYKLLLLPEKLLYYVMVHELCHLVHLNHSAAFWRLVARYVPDYRGCEKELKIQAYRKYPWLD